jgi:hypothetical protein
MTDERTPADGEDTPGHERHESEGTEEFSHSDRNPTRPVPTAPQAEPPDVPADGEPPEDETPAHEPVDAVAEHEAALERETERAVEEEPLSAPPVEPAAPRGPRSPIVTVLAVATAALFLTTVLFGLMAFAPRLAPIKSGPAKLAVQAQEAAELKELASGFAKNFVTLDYKTIEADLKRMTADTTTTFGEKLSRTIEAVGDQFKARKASSTGRALDAQILSQSNDSAIVQVLLRRTKRNVGTKGPETGNQIVNVTLVKTDDGWKVDDLSEPMEPNG